MLSQFTHYLQISNMIKENLLKLINDRSLTVGIIGLGYVGLPLLLRHAAVGINVVGFDIDEKKISALKSHKSYISHFKNRDIKEALSKTADVTTDFTRIKECDGIIICVPTPLNKYREPDLSFITSTLSTIQPYLRCGQVVSLESTTWPGTTDEVVAPVIEAVGLVLGTDAFLVFSPEREDPGNSDYSTHEIPKIVGGVTQSCIEVGEALYKLSIEQVVCVSSAKVAEMTKLLENIQRAVNIGLVNEMKVVAERMGVDIFEIVDAASTKPFGFMPYYPGPGLGGHCIPIDPFYLTWKAREYGLHTRFIELSGEINDGMPAYVVGKLTDGLNSRRKSLMGSKILILGIAYKRDVDDMRESASVKVMEKIRDMGGIIDYSDPYVPVFPKMRSHSFDLKSIDLTPENLSEYDAIIIATDHSDFDYQSIKLNAQLIIDTRGVFKGIHENKIIRA